ncbi:MAG: tRNA pseudouridine(55) synthase TruB [Patescibacteria group bacterium]
MIGFLVINKPAGMTSHDVVNQIRHLTGEQKVGHGGTLDPLATGVLIIGIGREATKQLGSFSEDTEKVYQAVIHLGATSDTDDAAGMVTESEIVSPPKKSEVIAAVKPFKGNIKQVPPAYSARQVGGQRAYDLARKGQNVNLGAGDVEISDLHIVNYTWPRLSIEVACSSGTYIRSLARDIGEALKVGGYLEELKRTRVGKVNLIVSVDLDSLTRENIVDKIMAVDKFIEMR